ncbi:MAG: septal ring lytic transglycosylase RlpA family protein [Pseudomonadota bacterium]
MKTSVSRALGIALTGTTFIAIGLLAPAHADRRAAPIVYADATDAPPSETAVQSDLATTATVTENRRIEFQYPTQSAAPSTATLTPTPTFPVSQGPSASTSDPFSFRVAEPSIEVSPASQPIRIASVQPQTTARTGKPLTLSRVRADRDAEIREERGEAGIYMDGFDGQPTANGEIFDETAMTAAHPSLPLPSLVQVINEDNGREVVVRVNDRGPFDGKRILELSPRAATVLGMGQGRFASVRLRYLGPAPVQQNPETYAMSTVENESLPPLAAAPVATPAPVREVSTVTQPVLPTTRPAPVRVASLSVGPAAPAGNVFIQAGAFSDIANAQRLTTNIGAGLPVKIEEARVNGGDFFRVLVGPFPSRDMAERERQQLSRDGVVDGFLTTR